MCERQVAEKRKGNLRAGEETYRHSTFQMAKRTTERYILIRIGSK
jgi:hypothetical protein